MRKLAAAALAGLMLSPACAKKNYNTFSHQGEYSTTELRALMESRKMDEIYFSTPTTSYCLVIKDKDTIILSGLSNFGLDDYKKMKPNDGRLKRRFERATDDDLNVQIKGNNYGDDRGDTYLTRSAFQNGRGLFEEHRMQVQDAISEAVKAVSALR